MRETDTSDKCTPCRLCAGEASFQFEKILRKKINAAFYRCANCHSLQTEEPYWLDDAYADGRRPLDTNAFNRIERLKQLTFFISKQMTTANPKLLDYGAGDGLLVRMLRDVGIDSYHFDPLSENVYALGFGANSTESFDILTAFEVWEHLPDPAGTIDEIFKFKPLVHFATTSLYTGQSSEWSYLNERTGRHVFFYSPKSVQMIAQKYGYEVKIFANKLLLFSKEGAGLNLHKRYFKLLFSARFAKWLPLYFSMFRKTNFAKSDKAKVIQMVDSGEMKI